MSDSETDSEDYDSTYDESAVETAPNKVQELIEDNKSLRRLMKRTSSSICSKSQDLQNFYFKLKASAQKLAEALRQEKARAGAQERQITFLKAETLALQLELTTKKTGGLLLDDGRIDNGDVEDQFRIECRKTLTAMKEELEEIEKEKSGIIAIHENYKLEMSNHWQNRETQFLGHLQEELANLKEQLVNQLEMEHGQEMAKKEIEITQLKAQVTELIKEHQADRKQLGIVEQEKEMHKKGLQEMEARKFQMSTEIESGKIAVKNLQDELVRNKQELEKVSLQLIEKEKSLDQLFDAYDKLRVDSQKPSNSAAAQQLDKVYAQFLCAEESMKKKNDEIAALTKRAETAEAKAREEVGLYEQQAEIFKKDFEMERLARQKQHSECENLKTVVGQYQLEMQRMKQDIMHYQAQQFHQQRPYAP